MFLGGVSQNKRDSTVFAFGLGFFIFGAGMLALFSVVAYNRYQAQAWPQAKATITHSYVKKHDRLNETYILSEKKSDKSFNRNNVDKEVYDQNKTTRYSPSLTYVYWVDGTKYIGEKIDYYSFDFPEKTQAEKLLERYPLDKESMVYYNPQNPREAILDNKYDYTGLLYQLPLSILCMVAGFRIGRAGFREMKSNPDYQKKIF